MRIAIYGALTLLLAQQGLAVKSSALAQIESHHEHTSNDMKFKSKKKVKTVFDQLGKDTISTIKTLTALGGIDGKALEVKPQPKKCCCWGTPIGDKLLQLAEGLDPEGKTLLAQIDGAGLSDSLGITSDNPNLFKMASELVTGDPNGLKGSGSKKSSKGKKKKGKNNNDSDDNDNDSNEDNNSMAQLMREFKEQEKLAS